MCISCGVIETDAKSGLSIVLNGLHTHSLHTHSNGASIFYLSVTQFPSERSSSITASLSGTEPRGLLEEVAYGVLSGLDGTGRYYFRAGLVHANARNPLSDYLDFLPPVENVLAKWRAANPSYNSPKQFLHVMGNCIS